MSPEAKVREALKDARAAVEKANSAANHLAGVILINWPSLAAGVTLVRESASLAQHAVQHFDHLTKAELKNAPRRRVRTLRRRAV
jgi:hypothetical protein